MSVDFDGMARQRTPQQTRQHEAHEDAHDSLPPGETSSRTQKTMSTHIGTPTCWIVFGNRDVVFIGRITTSVVKPCRDGIQGAGRRPLGQNKNYKTSNYRSWDPDTLQNLVHSSQLGIILAQKCTAESFWTLFLGFSFVVVSFWREVIISNPSNVRHWCQVWRSTLQACFRLRVSSIHQDGVAVGSKSIPYSHGLWFFLISSKIQDGWKIRLNSEA